MDEEKLMNLLRTNTPLGRFAEGEVRHVLEYMRSIGFEMVEEDAVIPAGMDLSSTMMSVTPASTPFYSSLKTKADQ